MSSYTALVQNYFKNTNLVNVFFFFAQYVDDAFCGGVFYKFNYQNRVLFFIYQSN
jgi:hypothetical protein